jgi:hypothetical protein
MKRVGIWGSALLVALAIVALAASVASARTAVLHQWVGPEKSLGAGDFFELAAEPGTSTEYETSAGSANCPPEEVREGEGLFPGLPALVGSVGTNDERTDRETIQNATGSFFGGSCSSSLPEGSPVRHYWYNSSYGGEPLGTLSVSTSGKAEFKTNPALQAVIFLEGPKGSCAYAAKKLKGTNETRPVLDLTFSKQKVKLDRDYSNYSACPRMMEVSVPFRAYSEYGTHVFAPINVEVF